MRQFSSSAGARQLLISPAQQARVTAARAGDAHAAVDFDNALAHDPVRLLSEVLSTKVVPSGSGVSYGHTFVTDRQTLLARVSIGYGHGLPRKAGNRVDVTWRLPTGEQVLLPIVGRVAMDEFVVDAGTTLVTPGALICVFGDTARGEISLAEWAAAIGESPVSIVACLDQRVTRSVCK